MNGRVRLVAWLIVFAASATVLAQSEGGDGGAAIDPSPAEPRAPAKLESLVPPSPKLTPHLQVEVELEHGTSLLGVVMNGIFVEQPFRGSYFRLDESRKKDIGAGLRIWYYDGLEGFLFVSYRQIDEVKVLRQLTEGDMERIRHKARQAAEAKAAAALVAAASGADPAPADTPTATAGKLESLSAEHRALLESYPAADYSPKLYASIQRDSILNGKDPTARQAEWMRVYPDWLRAFEAYNGIERAPKKAKPAAPAAAEAPIVAKTPAPSKPAPATSAPKPKATLKVTPRVRKDGRIDFGGAQTVKKKRSDASGKPIRKMR